MKRIKKFTALFAVAVLCLATLGADKLTASAASTTYVIGYSERESSWRYQEGSTWDVNNNGREFYYLEQYIKDGDKVVIATMASDAVTVNIPAKLSNLTVTGDGTAIVTAKGYDEVFLLSGTTTSVAGPATHVYMYDDCAATIVGDAKVIEIIGTGNGLSSSVNTKAKVDYLYGHDGSTAYYLYSNFTNGTCEVEDGLVKTAATNYTVVEYNKQLTQSTAASTVANAIAGTATTDTAAAATTTTSSASTSSASSASSSEYDAVPKTGDSLTVPALLAIAFVCFAGGMALRRKNA